jgi:hypothetical protein
VWIAVYSGGVRMVIRYEPKKILKRMANKKKVEELVTENLTLNRAVLNAVESSGVLGKKELQYVALGVIKGYREKAERLTEEDGISKAEAVEEVLENKKRLVQNVQNATLQKITQKVKEKYRGEFYEWLPSTAKVPDEKHKKKYGKRFQLGRGEAPGERIGCMCGMKILVDASRLVLD